MTTKTPHQPQLQEFQAYLQGERGLSPATVRNYLADVEPFLMFLEREGVPLAQLERADRPLLRRYLAWLMELGYARGSIARKVSTLRSYLRYRQARGDSALFIPPRRFGPRRTQPPPTFLGKDDASHLVEAPDLSRPTGLRDRALLELLYAAGLRVSEAVGLDIQGLDLPRREVQVTGKGDKERRVPMGRPAAQAVERYLREGRAVLHPRVAERALFLNATGKRLSQRSVQRLVKRYALEVGASPATHTHTLRHTFATHLLDGGADLRVVQHLLGHASPRTTQVYTHPTLAQARRLYTLAHPLASPSETSPLEGQADESRPLAREAS